jgi:hypothetical protein
MIMTFSRALAKPSIKTLSRNDGKGIFQVRVGIIATVITIAVVSRGDGTYVTTQDYAVKTDWQAGLYRVRYTPYEIPGEALDAALETYCFFYSLSVRHGHRPKPTWFVPIALKPMSAAI